MVPPLLVTGPAAEPLPELPEPELPEPEEGAGAGLLEPPVEVEPEELEELVVFFFFGFEAVVVLVLEVEPVFFLPLEAVVEVLAVGAELAEALGVAAVVDVLLAAVSVLAVLELKPASAETWVPTA